MRASWRPAVARRLVALAALLAALNIASALAVHSWLAELTVHFAVHYLAVALALALGLAALGRWAWVIVCVAVLALNLWRVWPYLGAPGRVDAEVSASSGIRVLQWNVGSAHQDPERVLAWILEREPELDLVLLLEVSRRWQPVLGALERFYPYSRIRMREDNYGIAVFSRLSGSDLRVLTHRGSGYPSVVTIAHAAGGGALFAVWALHPPPPLGAELAAMRNRQLETLLDTVRDPAMPMLVAGDLNVTPWSPWFKRLVREGRLRDSRVGRGITPTWAPAWWPVALGLPIDHLLSTPHFRVLERYLGPRAGSDHRPVVTRLILDHP